MNTPRELRTKRRQSQLRTRIGGRLASRPSRRQSQAKVISKETRIRVARQVCSDNGGVRTPAYTQPPHVLGSSRATVPHVYTAIAQDGVLCTVDPTQPKVARHLPYRHPSGCPSCASIGHNRFPGRQLLVAGPSCSIVFVCPHNTHARARKRRAQPSGGRWRRHSPPAAWQPPQA
jgi:hypothetical protein